MKNLTYEEIYKLAKKRVFAKKAFNYIFNCIFYFDSNKFI